MRSSKQTKVYSSDGSPIKVAPKKESDSSTITVSRIWKWISDIVAGIIGFIFTLGIFLNDIKEVILEIAPDWILPYTDTIFFVALAISLWSRWTMHKRYNTGAPIEGTEGEFQARTIYSAE